MGQTFTVDILESGGRKRIELPNDPELKALVGQQVTIYPASLLNRKRLFTTQDWIDGIRVLNALKGSENTPPVCGFIVTVKGKYLM